MVGCRFLSDGEQHMRRREFIAFIGGAAAAWPLAARAQQGERMRRIGVLMSASPDDPYQTTYLSAFMQGLQERGWTIGRNVRIDPRWGAGNTDLFRKYATELVALAPDVILATAGSIVGALEKESDTVPIVFVTTIDPVGGGWIESLARPGTNATGFAAYEFSIGGKWLGLLKEVAPSVKQVAVIRDPSVPAGSGGFAAIQTAATSSGVDAHRRPQCDRNRTRHHGLCDKGPAGWGTDHGRAGVFGETASRPNHRACGPAPPPRSLSHARLCRGGWLDLLRG
jgi:putative ABC transport system substrate-binding protein